MSLKSIQQTIAPYPKQSGFTLIELVLAIGIMIIMMSISYSSINHLISSKRELDDERDLSAVTNAVLGRMIRELQLAVSGTALLPDRKNLKNRFSTKTNLIGTSNQIGQGSSADEISFVAMDGGQYLPDGGAHTGMVQISYRVVKDPDQVESQPENYLLIREETPIIRPPERAYEKSMVFPICSNLVSMRLNYYDAADGTWSRTWSSEKKQGLPGMVKMNLKFRSALGRIVKLNTSIPMRSTAHNK